MPFYLSPRKRFREPLILILILILAVGNDIISCCADFDDGAGFVFFSGSAMACFIKF